MIEFGFSAGDVARLRFAVSRLWEVVASIRVLRGADGAGLHAPWVARVRPRLATAGLLDGSLLWRLVPAAPDRPPPFLLPAPGGLAPTLEEELAALAATAPATVRARLAEEIERYWELALASDWPAIHAVLEAEVLRAARVLVEDGAAGLLDGLHEDVRWEDGTLSVGAPGRGGRAVSGGAGLVLVPSAFLWPDVLAVADGPAPRLAYPAHGVGALWETPAEPPDALAAVLGTCRASMLATLGAPTSTTELARRTGMSAGGVSEHLATLRAAGLVRSHREGKRVLTSRTALADALLAGAGER